MALICICKGLSDSQMTAMQDQHHPATREELYALTLHNKIASGNKPETGREDWNGDEDLCGSCREDFQRVVDADPSARRVIPIVDVTVTGQPSPS